MADRIREIISLTHKKVEEKKMFSGLCFMVNDKMCIDIHEDKIMLRLDPGIYDEVMEKPGCEPMDFTGKVMRGYVFVQNHVLNTRKELNYWVQLALDFNKYAKSSKKSSVKKAAVRKR